MLLQVQACEPGVCCRHLQLWCDVACHESDTLTQSILCLLHWRRCCSVVWCLCAPRPWWESNSALAGHKAEIGGTSHTELCH